MYVLDFFIIKFGTTETYFYQENNIREEVVKYIIMKIVWKYYFTVDVNKIFSFLKHHMTSKKRVLK